MANTEKELLQKKNKGIAAAITVAALGYFVDIYDLLAFVIVRVPSLTSLGITGDANMVEGEKLISIQMLGLLIGGILWGVLGDKKGRLSVLFGSIFMYSTANIANAFVGDLTSYSILRFIAGVGLAGELGAGVTLVSELMSKENRGYGTTIIAAFGLLGAVAAGFISKIPPETFGIVWESWRLTYFIGGVLGLCLLALRIGVYESGMFQNVKSQEVKKGDFLYLFSRPKVFLKYLRCILIGLPTWFVVGILIAFSKEFGEIYQVKMDPATATMLAYGGISLGDIACGLLSQYLKSRKKAMFVFIGLTALFIVYYLNLGNASLNQFYFVCFMLGFSTGFWAVFVTIASEQFGTNIRATVTTTVPNFVRGALIPIISLFKFLRDPEVLGMINAAYAVAALCILLSVISIYYIEETFGKELNYTE